MTKGNELYYEYRKKLNKENNTRKVYKREDDQGSGTRNERYINDVLGGEGQAVSAQPAPPVAPAKTRESLLSEYRSALGQRMAAQSPQQTLMNVAESRVQFDQQQDARRRQTNSGPMRSAQPTNPEQKLPGSPYIGTENSLGRYGKGNIDLYNRPQYRNPDGSVSTVRSISIGTDDGEVLIPTVGRDANGRPRLLSDDEAIDEYFRTGNNLGTFKTIEEADDYADRLHKQQEAYYTGKGRELPSLEQMANPMRYAETRRQTAGGNSTMESSTVDRMLQASKQSEARAAEQKEQTYQRNAVNAFGNPNARAGGNWHTTPTGAWGAQDQNGRLVSPQSQRYEQDYRDTDPMRRLAAERVSAQDAENPLNARGNTKPYSVMTDDEKSVYNYLYSTYGPARAEEYHNGLMDEINRRIGQENYEANTNDLNTAQKALRSYQQGFSSGIEGILNAPAALVGAENRRARSAAEYENSALRSDQGNNTAQRIIYDIASSTGNMTPGMMASALGAPAAVGSALFATSAGGNAYAEAMNAGEDVSTSRAYAVQQFADEEATNWLLGGINAFGGGAVRKVMQNSAAGRTLDAAVNRLVKTESGRRMLHMMMDYVGDMAGEAQQEYVQFYTENFTKAILGMKDESGNPIDFNLNPADPDALYAALLGALNAGALNAAPAAARVIHGSGTDVQNAGGLAEDLRNTTREDYTSDAAYESAMRLEAVAREIGERQAAGRSPSAMDRIAFNEAMSDFIEASTEAEAESEEENPRTGFVDESGLTLQEITQGARQLREAENRTGVTGAEPSEAEPSRMTIPAEMKEQAAYDLLETRRPERIEWTDGAGTFVMHREADEGYSVTNQRGETSGLTEDQAAQMLPADTELTITWGEQRQAEQVKPTVTPESLPSYEASAPVAGINARTENINTGVDNRLMALAQDVTQERTQQKAAQMQSVYDAGKNMQAENLRSVMNGATMLTEQEKQAALQRGMQEAVTAARTQTAQATNAAVQKIRIPGVKEGNVSYDPKVDQSKLTEGQKVNAALAGAFASKVFGANVVLTQSNVVNGRYEGANGWFRFGGADDQTFYFDVNAGKNRVSDWKNSPLDATSVMPVIAHEGTHWMEKNHPEAYKGLESQVLDALSKDKAYTRNGELSLDDIISLEQKRMDREEPHADGRPHTVEEAKAELVARGCEDMLNGNEYAKAAFSDLDVEAKKTLWGHIKGVFESIQRFFDELLKNYRSNSQEARAIRRNKEAYAELLKTYGEILGMGREAETGGEINREEAANLRNAGIVLNDDGTVASMQYSSRYSWKTQEEVDKAVAALQKSLGVSKKEAQAFVESERSLTNLILSPGNVAAMDFIADDRYSAIKKNSDYPQGTVDFNNNCRKRVPFTTLFDRIQERNPNRLFTAEDLEIIRQNMIKHNYQVACGLCFVEERRQRLGEIADSFVQLYKNGAVLDQFVGKTPFEKMKAALDSVEGDDYTPTIADLITYKGLKRLEAEHKGIADAFRIFNNARGMQSGRLVEGRAEYKRELLTYKPSQVKRVNDLGGLRIFSYSDFEAVNLLDLVQIVQDASTKGIMIQAYTKVPAFAKVVRNTGIKLNRSLIAAGTGVKYVNGHMELDLDPVEGININDPDFFDSTDDRDVGNILVGMSDEQIRLAMNSPFVDYIIPFHTSLPKTILEAKKIDHWKNYKLSQTDKDMKTGKNAKNINIYTDVLQAAEAEGKPIKNKVDFVNKFLQVAKERNLIPRFSEFLNVDKDGNYVYTEGYHKFLIDFKLFDKNGRIVEQRPVRPVFDDAFNTKLMEDFAKGVGSVAISEELYRDTVDALNEKSSGETVQYSSRMSELEGEYREALEENNEDWLLQLVDQAAYEAGYTTTAYHGSPFEDIHVFNTRSDDTKKQANQLLFGTHFTQNLEYAKIYARKAKNSKGTSRMTTKSGQIYKTYLDLGKSLDLRTPTNLTPDTEEYRLYEDAPAKYKKKFPALTFSKYDTEQGLGSGQYITRSTLENVLQAMSPKEATDFLVDHGYDSILYDASYATPTSGNSRLTRDPSIIMLDPERIKSGDPITYDDNGKVIPLSERFNSENEDIRYSSRNASSDLNLLKAERLSEKYVKELEDTISERDTQIAELQEQMEKAVGAEKEKRKQQLAKLRKEKNDRIAYLEKSYRVNLNWQIAEMRQKMDRAIGEEKAQAKERLDALRAQKNQKIEEILQKNREQREQRRFNRSAQELIKRARRLKKMKGSPTFRAQVDALIGDLDLISPGMKDNTRQRLQKLKEEVEAQAALDPDYAKYEAVKYDKFLNRLKKKQIKDMTLEDIISIAEALAALEHSKKTADREIKEGQGKLFADYGRTAVAQLKKTKGINYGNEIGSMLGKYRLNMLNPTRAFQLLDGYQKGGVFTYFAKELNDGQTRAAEFRQKAEEMFQEIDNNPNLVNDFAKQNIEIMTVEGMKKISKGMRISLYLHAKNLDNVKHISYGGITIPNESLYKRGKYSEAYTAGETVHLIPQDSKNPDMMAAKAIRAITDQMTPEEKQYADIAYKFLNETTKEAINEVSLALDGYEKATVEDYFPIRSDPNFTQASMEGLLKDGTIEGMPMLKERTGSRNPILLEDASQVVLRQKNNTAMYYGLAIPIRNFNRFYNYTGTGFARSVKQSVGKTWGAAGQKYIDNVISDLQFGRQTQRTVLDSMKGLYAGTTLNLNLGVSIKQSASYPFAASVIGWAPLAKALGQRFTAADRAYMDSITPWGYMRRTGFSGTEMGEVARQRTGIDNNQTIQKAKTMLDFIRRVDVATTEKLFKACENYVQEKYPDLEVRGEEYGKKLAEIYNETLQRTQPSYDVMQRNEFLRSQNDLTKVLGAFKTQTFNMGGEILDAYGKWRAHSEYAKIDSSYETMAKESGKAFRTTVAATIVAQAMLVALSAVANAVLHKMKPYRDDKGEVTAESLTDRVMQDFATSFAGLTMGGSEAQAVVMAVFGKEKWYDIEYPGLSMINELVSSITDFSTAVRKSLDKDNAKAAEDRQKASVRLGKVLMQVFKLKGIPSQNLYNIANMVYLHGQDLANDELGSFTAGKGLFGLTDTSPTGKQFAKQAFYYYGKGDVSKGTKAAKRASESGIKDELGGKQENAIEYMKKSNLDDETMRMLWELAGWKANTFDKKMAK